MLRKMERKFGRYAIRGLMKYMTVLFLAGLLMAWLASDFYMEWLALDVEKTFFHFQFWRLFTFLIYPIEGDTSIFALISLYLYYMIGTMLELRWGSFRFNLFYLSGILFTILGTVITYVITWKVFGHGMSMAAGLGYINLAMFFAFSVEYGDVELLLFFLLPIKVKYLGLIYGGYYIYSFAKMFITCYKADLMIVFVLNFIPFLIGMLNFLLFYFVTRKERKAQRVTFGDRRRRFAYQHGVEAGRRDGGVVTDVGSRKVITKHRCVVCGRTELDDEMLEFRFCSKCEGDYEYCTDHLYTHTHVRREKTGSNLNAQITNDLFYGSDEKDS